MKAILFSIFVVSTLSSSAFAEKVYSLNCQVTVSSQDTARFIESQLNLNGSLNMAFGQQVSSFDDGVREANLTFQSDKNFSGPSISFRNPKIVWLKSQKFSSPSLDSNDAVETCILVEGVRVNPPTNPASMR